MRRDSICHVMIRLILSYAILCACETSMGLMPLAAPLTRASSVFVVMESPILTPVHGPSWLHRIGTSIDESCMGQVGSWPSSLVDRPPLSSDLDEPLARDEDGFDLTGSDLYRFNCQSCHKRDGGGVPPLIPSILGPVRATSPILFRAQMKARGFEVEEATVRQMATESRATLRARLANGGDKMPSFPHLQGVELEALLAYLRLLAGVPGATSEQMIVRVPVLHVGENVVKGTCHICHDASGPGRQREESLDSSMLRGVIPSLESIPRDRTQAEVIRKVRAGLTEPSSMMTRGRMPILDHITDREVEAVYRYLSAFSRDTEESRNPTEHER